MYKINLFRIILYQKYIFNYQIIGIIVKLSSTIIDYYLHEFAAIYDNVSDKFHFRYFNIYDIQLQIKKKKKLLYLSVFWLISMWLCNKREQLD